jgi:hypothetical protein
MASNAPARPHPREVHDEDSSAILRGLSDGDSAWSLSRGVRGLEPVRARGLRYVRGGGLRLQDEPERGLERLRGRHYERRDAMEKTRHDLRAVSSSTRSVRLGHPAHSHREPEVRLYDDSRRVRARPLDEFYGWSSKGSMGLRTPFEAATHLGRRGGRRESESRQAAKPAKPPEERVCLTLGLPVNLESGASGRAGAGSCSPDKPETAPNRSRAMTCAFVA